MKKLSICADLDQICTQFTDHHFDKNIGMKRNKRIQESVILPIILRSQSYPQRFSML